MRIFTECSNLIRRSSNINCVAITGSSGKTTLKEMTGQLLNKIYETYYSKKSYNNKFGVRYHSLILKKKINLVFLRLAWIKRRDLIFNKNYST